MGKQNKGSQTVQVQYDLYTENDNFYCMCDACAMMKDKKGKTLETSY